MSELNDKILSAKDALMITLGDQWQKYLNNMKMWFRHKWTKEQFDLESRKLLNSEKIHLHNQFLLAILNKIDALILPQQNVSSSSNQCNKNIPSISTDRNANRKRKRGSRINLERATFEPYDLYDYLSEENLDVIRPPNSNNDDPQPRMPSQRYCVQELFLPDTGFIMGRFLVGAWEFGLKNVDEEVSEYVCLAVQILLKNILSAIILKRKHARITAGVYYYDVGTPIKDPSLRNTLIKQKIDDDPIELDKEITSTKTRRSNDDNIFLSACEEL